MNMQYEVGLASFFVLFSFLLNNPERLATVSSPADYPVVKQIPQAPSWFSLYHWLHLNVLQV